MRLLVTVERYAPAIGGAERVAQRVAEGLAARGHEVHVLTSGSRRDHELDGVQVHRLPLSGNEARGIRGETATALELIDRIAPEVVFNYAAQSWPTDCCYALLARERRPRMVMAPCGFSGLGSRRYAGYFAAMPERLRSYDMLILHSSVYQDWDFAAAAGVRSMVVIPNGADPPHETDDAVSPHQGDTALAVTVGSHVASKGHAEFTRAVRILTRRLPVRGAIVAPSREGLEAVRGCNLTCQARAWMRRSTMRVIDGTPAGVVQKMVAAADLFLFASKIECAPLVILEAMAAGTPWVSYDVGNVSELAGGLVVNSFPELVSAAEQILRGDRPELGQEGRKAWETSHRWEGILDRYESVFEEVLRAPSVLRC